MVPSNEAPSDSDDVTIGNDGCTVISEHASLSPVAALDSPVSKTTKPKKGSFFSSLKNVFADDFKYEESPEYSSSFRQIIVKGRDILSYRQEEIDRMSVEEAKEILFHVFLEGHLRKKGFRGLQLWKRRFFEVMGSSLLYFDVGAIFVCDCRSATEKLLGDVARLLRMERWW